MAAKALLPPSSSSLLGVCWGGVALSWFPDGTGGGGTWGWQARHPEQRDLAGVNWPALTAFVSLCGCLSVSVSGSVSVTCSPPSPGQPGWVGVGAGDLSPAACLPSETPGVGADGAVSYGPPGPPPPTPMLLLCLGGGCAAPPQRGQSLGPSRPSQGLVHSGATQVSAQ